MTYRVIEPTDEAIRPATGPLNLLEYEAAARDSGRM
jgi:hypothetical protein